MDSSTKPLRVLIVYYSFTQETAKAARTIGDVFAARNCEVVYGPITFTDDRYKECIKLPMVPFWDAVLPLLLPQLTGKTGQYQIDPDVLAQSYDLICIGSPTWWFNASMPVRSLLQSDQMKSVLQGKPFGAFIVCREYWRTALWRIKSLGRRQGGKFIGGTGLAFPGSTSHTVSIGYTYVTTGEDLGYGIGEQGLQKAVTFAEKLLARVSPQVQPQVMQAA
jgi:flavodoxin